MNIYFTILMLLLFTFSSKAQVTEQFRTKFEITQRGGVTLLGNTGLHCSNAPGDVSCFGNSCPNIVNDAAPNSNFSDNCVRSRFVDFDNDASTFMSSSDSLVLPDCSQITWAGLFWGARRTAGLTTGFETIKIKANNGAYTSITADTVLLNTIGFNSYHCFKNMTSFVNANGEARYTIADIFTESGMIGTTNNFSSWVLVIVYQNDLLPMRKINCLKGLANISSTAIDVLVNNFVTPISGPVFFELGVYNHDGDRSLGGDSLLFNGAGTFVPVHDALNPRNNVMNSSISKNGVHTPYRLPMYYNTLSLDADIFSPDNTAKNFIGNGATNATIRMKTGGETYLVQALTSAIDVYNPYLTSNMVYTDLNGGSINPGDLIEFKVTIKNTGNDIAENAYLIDTIPANLHYVPNSLTIVYGPNSGLKTDALNDDQAEIDNSIIKFRIGSTADNLNGGNVAPSINGADSTIITFQVQASSDCSLLEVDNIAENTAYLFGTGFVDQIEYERASYNGLFSNIGCPLSGATLIIINNCVTLNSPVNTNFEVICEKDFLNFQWESISVAKEYQLDFSNNGFDFESIKTFKINEFTIEDSFSLTLDMPRNDFYVRLRVFGGSDQLISEQIVFVQCKKDETKISPNPSDGFVSINGFEKNSKLKIVDIYGNTILTKDLEKNTDTVKLESSYPEILFFIIESFNKRDVIKVINKK